MNIDLSTLEISELNSKQDTDLDLSNTFNISKHPSGNLLSTHKLKDKKHKKVKIVNPDEDDEEPSYISFYRYPIKTNFDQKKKNQIQVIDTHYDKSNSIQLNTSTRRGSLFTNALKRSVTPQKADINLLKEIDEQEEKKNIFKNLQISKIRKLFIVKIRQLSQSYNFRHLKKFQLDLIGDVSSSSQYQKPDNATEPLFYHKQINLILTQIVTFLNEKITQTPESKFFLIWNICFSISVLFFIFYLPFSYSFNIQLPYVEQIILVVFALKILLSPVLGFYEKGEMVLDITKTTKKYFKTPFLIDVLILLSMILDSFQFVIYLRLPQMLTIMKKISYQSQFIRKHESVQLVFRMLIILLLQVQVGGCLFHYVGQSQSYTNPTNNWLYQQNILNSDWTDRYICSIYFSFTSLMNVIYGDIHAYNHAERFTSMAICLCSYISFGYFVTVVGLLLSEYASSIQEFFQKRQIIMNYMIQRSISPSIQIKMMYYLEHMLLKSQGKEDGSQKLLEEVPVSLKNSLYQEFFGSILKLNKYIPNHFSSSFLKDLTLEMQEITIQPGKQFAVAGEISNKVYFIVQGQVEILIHQRKQDCILQKFTQKGIDICLKSAFTNQPLLYSAKSGNEQLTLVYFEMEKLQKVLKRYPYEFESFCQWRDELIFKEQQLTFKCKSCRNVDHELDECPMVNLRLPRQKIISQFLFDEFQVRNQWKRKTFTTKVLSSQPMIKLKLKQMRIFMIKAVSPNNTYDDEQLIQMCDEAFFKAMPAIKLINLTENIMKEFNPSKENENLDLNLETLKMQSSLQKRISLEKIQEDSQSSSSSTSETESSSDDLKDDKEKETPDLNSFSPGKLSSFAKPSKQLLNNKKPMQKEVPNIISDIVARQKNDLLIKQKQQVINMNSILEQKKKINNDPFKPNVPIQGFRKRTDKMSNLYTKILFREQQKQKRLKYLQLLWMQKQSSNTPDFKSKQSESSQGYAESFQFFSKTELGKKKNKNSSSMFILDFDKCEIYKRYNPYYNYLNVISRLNQSQTSLSKQGKQNLKLFLLCQSSK